MNIIIIIVLTATSGSLPITVAGRIIIESLGRGKTELLQLITVAGLNNTESLGRGKTELLQLITLKNAPSFTIDRSRHLLKQ